MQATSAKLVRAITNDRLRNEGDGFMRALQSGPKRNLAPFYHRKSLHQQRRTGFDQSQNAPVEKPIQPAADRTAHKTDRLKGGQNCPIGCVALPDRWKALFVRQQIEIADKMCGEARALCFAGDIEMRGTQFAELSA